MSDIEIKPIRHPEFLISEEDLAASWNGPQVCGCNECAPLRERYSHDQWSSEATAERQRLALPVFKNAKYVGPVFGIYQITLKTERLPSPDSHLGHEGSE